MKKMCKAVLTGMCVSSLIFVLTQLIFCMADGGAMLVETDMLVGCLIIGVGFGLPTVIYDSERLPGWAKALIHMGFGCTVLTVVSLMCYMPSFDGVSAAVVNGGWIILAELAVAFLVWLGFQLFYKMEAKSINKKIKQMQSGKTD